MHKLCLPVSQVRSLGLALLLSWICLPAKDAQAHETDNFYLPLDVELAALDDFFGALHTRVIEEAVEEVNARIEQALAVKDTRTRDQRLRELHEPDTVATAVARRFGSPLTETERASHALRGSRARMAFPGRKPSHAGIKMNMVGRFPLDLRMLYMFLQADTVKAYGVYFGTDKLTHFHHLGWSYYQYYRALIRAGLSRDAAYDRVLKRYGTGSFLAENKMFGTIGTGVYSNADMCVNLMGFKFFLNLTEKVTLKGWDCEPLVVRTGVFWRVNQHVRPLSGWWGAFVSDHWNEALNPSLYDPTMRPGVRRVLRARADRIARFYHEKDGRPKDPGYFEQLAKELSTYYGEPYGHSGQGEKLMHIGNTCLPALERQRDGSTANQ